MFFLKKRRLPQREQVKVYNLGFGLSPEAVQFGKGALASNLVAPPVPTPTDLSWGWVGDAGPGIDLRAWPRGRGSGLPLRHAITLRLPDCYQRRGPGLPGVAYFMGQFEGVNDHFQPTSPDDPLAAVVRASIDHPQLSLRVGTLREQMALIWLTEEELAAGPTPPPPDTRRPGEHLGDPEGANAWDEPLGRFPWDPHATRWVYLAERTGDPNAGVAPSELQDSAYVMPWRNKELFAELVFCDDHLGGTTEAGSGSGLPLGLTPWYLELATPTWNYDYGNRETHLIDLETDTFAIC